MSKSKTAIFNCRVILGSLTFAAGKPVPIGGKNGLSENEAERLHREFGTPIKSSREQDLAADTNLKREVAELGQELVKAGIERAELERKLQAAEEANADLDERLVQAEADNGVLAARIAELEADSSAKS